MSISIQEESKKWIIQCPRCGKSASLYDVGGIRYKAASVGKRVLGYCSDCKRYRFLRMYKKEK